MMTRCSSNSGTPSRRRLPSRKKLRGPSPDALLSHCMCLVSLFSPLFVCLFLFVMLFCCHNHRMFPVAVTVPLSLFHCRCHCRLFPAPNASQGYRCPSVLRCEQRPFLAATVTSVVTYPQSHPPRF